jgi:uncharacterized protein YbaR (Trm112 family)
VNETKIICPSCSHVFNAPVRTSGELTCEKCGEAFPVPLVLVSHQKPEKAMLNYLGTIANTLAENQQRLDAMQTRITGQLKAIQMFAMLTALPLIFAAAVLVGSTLLAMLHSPS